MLKKNLILVFIFSLLVGSLSAQGFLKRQGKDIVDENGNPYILKGMGLGGWMLQEGYMLQTASFANPQYQIRAKIEELIGPTKTDQFYEAWLANHVRKIDIDSLKAWGFNSVRLPMHYNLFTLPIQEEPVAGQHTWLDKGFVLTDSLISWCKQNEMYVVLDLHAAPGGQGQDAGISDYNPDLPSLWESQANRDKTVAIWRRLAERYKDEPWIAGYDLINEPNWPIPGNFALKGLYQDITTSIREVDTTHIIFIEGNWFANDFTNLTPPWDSNMVYSPHKYWSINDQASIQWVLDIRQQHNVPLYFGETGENSNTWFRDAAHLFQENGIGWAWWPMKKVESIAGPLSVDKTTDYEVLLNFWNNGGSQPNSFFAEAALMDLTEKLKLENCTYHPDVIDALIRQTESDEVIPYKTSLIPGTVYATDFDMGRAGFAYFDSDLANYSVSTGSYSSWNNGWSYRNDGVDIEKSQNQVNSNGYNVGWVKDGEWMQYDVNITQDGLYTLESRLATQETNGRFHLELDGADITRTIYVPSTGGWQSWQTNTLTNIALTSGKAKLRFYTDGGEYNLSSFTFTRTGDMDAIDTEFLAGYTEDATTIQVHLNKPLTYFVPTGSLDLLLFVNSTSVPIASVEIDSLNTRIVKLKVNSPLTSSDVIKVSYTGSQLVAVDNKAVVSFFNKPIQNDIPIVHDVPGRVECEDFFFQSGISLENTSDIGGGQNIGFLDPGDYLDYNINVANSGTYQVEFRTAAESEIGGVELQLVDAQGVATSIGTADFPSTGGWQVWNTSSQNVRLPAGQHQLRVLITKPLFNFNWMQFSFLASKEEVALKDLVQVFPNPAQESLFIRGEWPKPQEAELRIYNLTGQEVMGRWLPASSQVDQELPINKLVPGVYFLQILLEDGSMMREKFVKR
ncbi:MAG: carbohydrate-binding protein [Bacteroidota bacterium]